MTFTAFAKQALVYKTNGERKHKHSISPTGHPIRPYMINMLHSAECRFRVHQEWLHNALQSFCASVFQGLLLASTPAQHKAPKLQPPGTHKKCMAPKLLNLSPCFLGDAVHARIPGSCIGLCIDL